MRKRPSKTHFIPIWDCPHCGTKNAPISTRGPFIKEGLPEIYISYCSICEMVPHYKKQIKGYVSPEEMETELGWKPVPESEIPADSEESDQDDEPSAEAPTAILVP